MKSPTKKINLYTVSLTPNPAKNVQSNYEITAGSFSDAMHFALEAAKAKYNDMDFYVSGIIQQSIHNKINVSALGHNIELIPQSLKIPETLITKDLFVSIVIYTTDFLSIKEKGFIAKSENQLNTNISKWIIQSGLLLDSPFNQYETAETIMNKFTKINPINTISTSIIKYRGNI